MDQAKLARMQASVRIGTFCSFLWILEVLESESVFSADGFQAHHLGNVMSQLPRSGRENQFQFITDS